jgi:DNA-binding transcriptional ArsR family regulator
LQLIGFLFNIHIPETRHFSSHCRPNPTSDPGPDRCAGITPSAIAEHFDITRQSISKHLRILFEFDLLAHKQGGREIFYELKIAKMKEIDIWLDQFRKMMEKVSDNWMNYCTP